MTPASRSEDFHHLRHRSSVLQNITETTIFKSMITFRKTTAAMVAPPSLPPVFAPATAPREDARAEPAWRTLPLEGVFEFSYQDVSGRPSLRRVNAVELKVGPGKMLLGGIDRDLDAYRGFRVDRIHALRPAEGSEVVSRNILDWLLDRAARQAKAQARRDGAAKRAFPAAEPVAALAG